MSDKQVCSYCGKEVFKPLHVAAGRWREKERYFCSRDCMGLWRLSLKEPSYLSLFMLDKGITPAALNRSLARYRDMKMPQMSKVIIGGINPLWGTVDSKLLAKGMGAAVSDIVGMDGMEYGDLSFDYRRVLQYLGGGWVVGEKRRKETELQRVIRSYDLDLREFISEQSKSFYWLRNERMLSGDESVNVVRNCIDVLNELQRALNVVYTGTKWSGAYDLLTKREGNMTAKVAVHLSRVIGLMGINVDYRVLLEPVLPHQYGSGIKRELSHINNGK